MRIMVLLATSKAVANFPLRAFCPWNLFYCLTLRIGQVVKVFKNVTFIHFRLIIFLEEVAILMSRSFCP